jgi:hypothetical protein
VKAARVLVLALGLGLLAAGCGKDAPTRPSEPVLSPRIAAVFPAARSRGVLYDTAIWVRFTEGLDPASVNERTVFLKLDTVRIPTTITYDSVTRTIHLAPRQTLALRRTHTVEITPGVATATGHPLGETSFWQFTTNSLRRPEPTIPADGARGESPFAALQWAATETSAGTVEYEVCLGADSVAVATRGVPVLRVEPHAYSLPRTRWGFETRTYWAVTAVNRSTSERLAGPAAGFETLQAGLPVDSLDVPPDDWGYYWVPLSRRICTGLSSGPDYRNGIRWRIRETASGRKLAGARLSINANRVVDIATYHPAIFGVEEPWAPCGFGAAIPVLDRQAELAIATTSAGTQNLRFESDYFTAHLEAAARYGIVHGYALSTYINLGYFSPSSVNEVDRPVLRLYYYRLP